MINTMSTLRIALIGDQRQAVKAHVAIPLALRLAGGSLHLTIAETWFSTPSLKDDLENQLRGFHGIWCVPGSPYQSMDGALRAIRLPANSACLFSAPAAAPNTP
jgi:CTP synthase (UTP-ammonia lyase)